MRLSFLASFQSTMNVCHIFLQETPRQYRYFEQYTFAVNIRIFCQNLETVMEFN